MNRIVDVTIGGVTGFFLNLGGPAVARYLLSGIAFGVGLHFVAIVIATAISDR